MKDAGVLYLYELKNVAEPGDMPREALDRITNKHWFEIMTIGMNRQYLAKGVMEQIDLRVRIHFEPMARIGVYAVLGNGDQYIIVDATPNLNVDGLRCTDLSLQRLEEKFDVVSET